MVLTWGIRAKCPSERRSPHYTLGEAKSQKSSSCHKCVLLMDHHCPWIHNCVGLFNRRYFFNFCFFTTIGLYFVAISLLPYYISLKQHYNPSSFPWLWFPKSSIAENMSEHLESRTDLVFAFCCLVILPLRKRIQVQYFHNWVIVFTSERRNFSPLSRTVNYSK